MTPWAAMTRRGTSSTARSRRRGISISAWRWSARPRVLEAELARHAGVDSRARPHRRRARRGGDGRVAGGGAAAQAAAPRSRSPPRRWRAARRRRCSAPATPARRSWRRTARSACCRASIARRWRRRFRRARRPAVLLDVGASVECRPQHLLQFAVMGSVYARVAFGIERRASACCRSARKRRKGNELTREAHQLLKASPLDFIGNVEARDVYSGQADVIVCDGFTGNVALKISEGLVEVVEDLLQRGAVEHVHDARRIAADAAGAAALPPPRRLLRIRRRAAARRRRRRHRRTRPVEREGRAQRRRDGVPLRGRAASSSASSGDIAAAAVPQPVIAFIFPGQGSQKVGMGKALADAFPICRETFEEADAALGEPLSRLCFDGPEDQLTLTENTQPAILAVSIAAYRLLDVARPRAGVRRRPQPRRVLGQRRRRHLRVRRCAAASCAAAAATCRRRCRSARARWRPSSGSTPRRSRRRAPRRPQGEVVSPANLNGAGQVVIAGARDAVTRAGERAKALGAKRVVPLPVSAPFHCALMKPAEERLAPELRALTTQRPARADRRQRRRRAETRRARRRSRRWSQQVVVAGALGSRRRAPCV